jgi:multiple sugar transport system ATP-binding protein
MDEPLSNLDAKLRVQTRTQIASLQRRLATTTVYVTHDQVEAMTMGDRVAVLKDGLLQQVGTPREMYDKPANVFVAGFIGSPAMNITSATLVEGGARLGSMTVPLSREAQAAASRSGSKNVTLGFRPEDLQPAAEGEGFPVTVNVVEELGSDAFLYGTIEADSGDLHDVIARVDARRVPRKGDRVWLKVRTGDEHLFDAESGERLSV